MNERNDRSHRYPTQPYGSIPTFQGEEEEAAFFDTHDFTEF